MTRLTQSDLTAIRRRALPRMKASDIAEAKPGRETDAATHLAALDEYLSHFVAPGDGKCISCGEPQGGFAAGLMGTGFTWGLAHGEGHCGTCGYPARAYHEIKTDDDKPIRLSGLVLQYHPDELSFADPNDGGT